MARTEDELRAIADEVLKEEGRELARRIMSAPTPEQWFQAGRGGKPGMALSMLEYLAELEGAEEPDGP